MQQLSILPGVLGQLGLHIGRHMLSLHEYAQRLAHGAFVASSSKLGVSLPAWCSLATLEVPVLLYMSALLAWAAFRSRHARSVAILLSAHYALLRLGPAFMLNAPMIEQPNNVITCFLLSPQRMGHVATSYTLIKVRSWDSSLLLLPPWDGTPAGPCVFSRSPTC